MSVRGGGGCAQVRTAGSCLRRDPTCHPIGSAGASRQHDFDCRVLYPLKVKPLTPLHSSLSASQNHFQQHARDGFKYWWRERPKQCCGKRNQVFFEPFKSVRTCPRQLYPL